MLNSFSLSSSGLAATKAPPSLEQGLAGPVRRANLKRSQTNATGEANAQGLVWGLGYVKSLRRKDRPLGLDDSVTSTDCEG